MVIGKGTIDYVIKEIRNPLKKELEKTFWIQVITLIIVIASLIVSLLTFIRLIGWI